MKFPRRLLVSVLSLLACSSVFGQSTDTLKVIHTSDCHLIFNLDEVDPAITRARKFNHTDDDSLPAVSDHNDSLELFLTTIPRQVGANAVVVTGDLIEFFEAQTVHNTLVSGQVEQFRTVYDKSPVPVYLTLGNHCITTYTVREKDSTLATSQRHAGKARAAWIRNIPCFYNGTYYEKVFSVGKTKYHFVFLDNGYESLGDGQKVDKTQCDWLSERMELAGNDPVVLLFHIYYAVGDMNGDGISFKERGPVNWPTAKECSTGLLKIINEHKNIRALVVGHGHSDVYEKIRFPGGSDVYQIETGSVYNGLNNWRMFRMTENSIIVSKVGGEGTALSIDLGFRQ
ncbi:MAG: metallophosphoesterase [Bacteroidota bacterium]